MKITRMNWQHRRDFSAEYTCEGCGNKQIDDSGYDDDYYHRNVIPNKKCAKCGESSITLGVTIKPQKTKYPEGLQI
jgi:predicted RNA-binding Zn-ribbon protein involved in translation (DUF1610 family)